MTSLFLKLNHSSYSTNKVNKAHKSFLLIDINKHLSRLEGENKGDWDIFN